MYRMCDSHEEELIYFWFVTLFVFIRKREQYQSENT